MAEETVTTYTTEIPVDSKAGAPEKSPIDVSVPMMMWTYVTFALTAFILYKAAWKPILAGLDRREDILRQSMENAEQLRIQMEHIEQTRSGILTEAEKQSRELIDKGRQAAADAARTIENKAREESQILLENARREIRAEADKARAALRRESAELAVGISRKILRDNLDEKRGRELADQLISEV